MIEDGQLDASDLSDAQLQRQASLFKCQLDWLVYGYEVVAEETRQWALATRTQGRSVQSELDFGAQECPDCHRSLRGSRCD
ncbi:MAG: hypothetical protein ACREJV_15595, partial [Candidatus Rokuibacteriota bacterium]